MTHATHFPSPRFAVALLLLTGGVAQAAFPSRDEVRAAQRVCRQLSADLSLANARLQPLALDHSRKLGELEFVLTALDEEIQVYEDQRDRLERSEHPDAPRALQQVKLRLEDFVRRRNALRQRHKDLLARHMQLVLENGDPLPLDEREAWRKSLDDALKSLTSSAAPPVAKKEQGRTAKRVPPVSKQQRRPVRPRCAWPRR